MKTTESQPHAKFRDLELSQVENGKWSFTPGGEKIYRNIAGMVAMTITLVIGLFGSCAAAHGDLLARTSIAILLGNVISIWSKLKGRKEAPVAAQPDPLLQESIKDHLGPLSLAIVFFIMGYGAAKEFIGTLYLIASTYIIFLRIFLILIRLRGCLKK